MVVSQYEIFWVNLDPTIGSEIKKIRPCIVLSPNEMNHNIKTIIIAPLTSNMKNYPTRTKIKFNNRDGWVVVDQIRCIDKARLVKHGGKLDREFIIPIKKIIKEMLVD
ncbi:MAG: type II toxin-antitoxin system PemK/MazF family toxin [Clostridiales bacterium]|nr:type II toxin-antitoxin system PemK/MazF family toxin [Clostridiales bacterium]